MSQIDRIPIESATTVRAAIYCRISRDREGAGLGVDRQEQECRALAERLGWQVVTVYADNDISAYSGKRRPQYEAMMRAVQDGHISALLAWHPDRLHRRVVELEGFIGMIEAHRVQIQTVASGTYDLTTPDGRMIARMLGSVAQREIEHTKKRIQAQKERAAADGKYRGGPRPYGFAGKEHEEQGLTSGVDIIEPEADVIRRMTAGALAGRSLHSIARELNAAGLRTSTGKEWTQPRVRDVLIRPRNAGLIHVGRADGRTETREQREQEFRIVGKAEWTAIVTEDEWRAVHTMLVDPSRRTNQKNDARWLLTGIAVCGHEGCDSKMRMTTGGSTKPKKAKTKVRARRANYRCRDRNHLTIDAVKTENFILGVVAEMVRDPRVQAALLPNDDAMTADRGRRSVLAVRLEQTEKDYDDDLIDARRFKSKTDSIKAEMEEIEARLTSGIQQSQTGTVLNAPDPGDAFLEAPLDVQRAVLRTVLQVTVMPAAMRGGSWTSDRLKIDPAVPPEVIEPAATDPAKGR